MSSPGWLIRSSAELPESDEWLGPSERETLAGLRFAKRRGDWRLGRFAAKAALAAWLDVSPDRVEAVACADGAPEARLDGSPAPAALSLSHRAGRALVVVGEPGGALGCDLELVERRSPAFIEDWLAPDERTLVAGAGPESRDLAANLVWTAKEAAAKVRRAGLRLDLRDAMTELPEVAPTGGAWRELAIRWTDRGSRTRGWWRTEPGWVMAVTGDPAPDLPLPLE
jgi:4'-phosphopantetheinyl transferase